MQKETPARAREGQPSSPLAARSRRWWDRTYRVGTLLALALVVCAIGGSDARGQRTGQVQRVIDLNGPWQVEQGNMEDVPRAFAHEVVVPGLLDMARPPFHDVGKPIPASGVLVPAHVHARGPVPDDLLKLHKVSSSRETRPTGSTSSCRATSRSGPRASLSAS